MNNEQLKLVGQKLLKRIDLVILGVIIALLGGVVYLYIAEQGHTFPPIDKDSPPQLQEHVADSPAYQEVRTKFIEINTNIAEDPIVRRAVQNNMFDRKSVEEQAKIQKELNEQYNRAEDRFNGGQVEEAKRMLRQILDRDANHRPANQLMDRITELESPKPAETPAADGAAAP